jgi:Holliday junction resolvasome RuvABC endonuclease subunit
MKICGIDPSINSTGKCIMELDDGYNIVSVKFYGYNMVRKRCLESDDVHMDCLGTKYNKLCMFDRQDIAYAFLKRDMEDVTHIAFEGYAFGKSGTSSLLQLGEFIGGMKKMFYDMGKGIIIYPPRVVKHFATGSGNADKSQMSLAFKSDFPQFYPEIFAQFPQNEDPHSDLCDAFWIAETLRNHLIYDIMGPQYMEEGTVALLESKSTKKSQSIVETELVKK